MNTDQYTLRRQEIYENIRTGLSGELSDMRSIADDQLYSMIDREVKLADKRYALSAEDKLDLRNSLFNAFRKLDILQELVDKKEITEIMVNGKDHIFVEYLGQIKEWKSGFKTNEQLEDMIQQIVSRVNRVVNVSSPIADARLEDGSRVHVVLPPISLSGPVITIRKFPDPITMEKLIAFGSVSTEAADFLKLLVHSGYNIFVSGGTNSGKTTFLNALSSFIPDDERVITIEDSAELKLSHIRNLVSLEARCANAQGEGSVSISDLIRASLRMNPDRIVVGEVRGREALDMLQAMNTGHDGSLSTGHANSPKDMLSRIETMVLSAEALPLAAIRSQMAGALDIMVHLGRLRDRSRRVLSIMEVGAYENGEVTMYPLYEFCERTDKAYAGEKVVGSLKKVGELKNRTKLIAAGDELRYIPAEHS